MAYTKTTWRTDDVITAEKLNNAEQGIAQNAHDIETINDSVEELSEDATATGDAVSELKSDLDPLINVSTSGAVSGYYISSLNGGRSANENFSYIEFDVVGNGKIVYNTQRAETNIGIAFYDKGGTYLAGYAAIAGSQTLTVPTNAATAKACYRTAHASAFYVKYVTIFEQIAEGLAHIDTPKFVSTDGSDTNDGNSKATAYATINKALSSGASTIFIANGTYTEDISSIYSIYAWKHIKIIADKAILYTATELQFRFTYVDISGLSIISTAESGNVSCFYLLNCRGKITNCDASNAPYMGFRCDGSLMSFEKCTAHDNAIDGFNGHTASTGYETKCTFVDCKAYSNGDDGLSIHENGEMYVDGGEYYSNGSTGIAPHQSCKATIRNAYIHDNGTSGIEFFNPSTGDGYQVVNAMTFGNFLENNTKYGVDTSYYKLISVNDRFHTNTLGTINTGTGATVDIY